MTTSTNSFKNALLLATVLGLVFFSITAQFVNAEDTTTDETTSVIAEVTTDTEDEDGSDPTEDTEEKRAVMKAQIESLQKLIQERKAQFKANQEIRKEERAQTIEEWKAAMAEDRAAFMADLEGMTPEEKKAAMLDFITKLRAAIEAKKAEMMAKRDEVVEAHQERKADRIEDREAFRVSLEGMTPEEKRAAIMERVAALKAALEAKLSEEATEEEEEEEVGEEEEEVAS